MLRLVLKHIFTKSEILILLQVSSCYSAYFLFGKKNSTFALKFSKHTIDFPSYEKILYIFKRKTKTVESSPVR